MATKTATQIRAAVRQNTSTVNSLVVTDAELDDRINEALSALYDEVVGVYEHYFQSTFAFTLSTTNVVALPTDFYKDLGLDLNPGKGATTVHRGGSFLERNSGRRVYLITGQNLEVRPLSSFGGSYALYYTPLPPELNKSTPDFTVRLFTQSLPGFTPAGAGVGKTLTEIGNGALVIDGVAPIAGDRVLFNCTPFLQENSGIYTVTAPGTAGTPWVLTRATDYDSNAEIAFGQQVAVTAGTAYAGMRFNQTATTISIDVLPLTFAEPAMLQALSPWTEYVVLGATVAVFDKRQMDAGGFPGRFAAQQRRVKAMAVNRASEPQQVALTRGPGSGSGFWNDEDLPR